MTTRSLSTCALIAACGLAGACSQHEAPPAPVAQNGALEGGNVARVGATSIPASLVSSVAAAQGLTPREALEALVDDDLLAEAARARHLDAVPSRKVELLALRARLVAKRIREDAIAAGPATDAEVAELTALHWAEVDHPEEARVVHVVVQRSKKPNAQKDKAAFALAVTLQHAVADATSEADFEARAKAVPHEGFDVVVQPLPAMTADGRLAEGGNLYPEFSRPAFALPIGATSEVVESPAGWHVIRMVARLPAYTMPLEERRAAFLFEAREHRAANALQEILTRERAAVHLESPSAVDTILGEAKLH